MNTRTKAGRTSLAKARKQLREPGEMFFFEHAGWSYNPATETAQQGRERCAIALAEAEALMHELGWSCEWDWDESACSGCDCGSKECDCASGASHETLGCVLRDVHGKVLESLWGICKPTREYKRVVEAELAEEALTHLNEMRVSAFAEPL